MHLGFEVEDSWEAAFMRFAIRFVLFTLVLVAARVWPEGAATRPRDPINFVPWRRKPMKPVVSTVEANVVDATESDAASLLLYGPVILVLALINRAMGRIADELRVQKSVPGAALRGGAGGALPSGRDRTAWETAGLPTVEMLPKEVRIEGFAPFEEASPLGSRELGLLSKVRKWLNDDAEFSRWASE